MAGLNLLLRDNLPWLLGGGLALAVLLVLRRPIGGLLRLALRTAVGMGVLAAVSQVGAAAGIGLGVNLFNGLVLGVLGVPGFGLLLLLDWTLKTGGVL